MSNKGNFKASTEQYRTIKGEHYICWCSDSTNIQIKMYREAGIKCAKRGVDLYIRESDQNKALATFFLSRVPV